MATDSRQHRLGLILAGAAALCWSTSGLFTRLIDADLMTMLFWRGLFSGTTVFIAFFLMEGRAGLAKLKTLGWPAFAVAVLSATSMITGIGSLRYGAIADSMVIYGTAPFVTAALAYLLFRERPSNSTLIAATVAVLGIVIMLWGNDFGGNIFGILLACIMTVSMAGFSVLLRQFRDVPMLPAMASSGYLVSIFCAFFATTLSTTSHDFFLIALFGMLQNAAGLILYTLGSRKIPAAEAALLATLEMPFAPIWVWVLLGEAPNIYSLIGGIVVMCALVGHITGEFRKTGAVAA